MPYFEGDFWPNVLEESIKELDQEEEEKRRREEEEAAAAEEAEAACDVGEGPEAKTMDMVRAMFTSPSASAHYAHTNLSFITMELWELQVIFTGRWYHFYL